MKTKSSLFAISIVAVVILVVGIRVLAGEEEESVHLSGLINDYSPANGVKPVGPWEIRGAWTLELTEDSTKAHFSAYLTMENSDFWILQNPAAIDNPAARTPHTHHLTMEDATVSPLANGGFEVNGTVSIAANGAPAPFTLPPNQPSQLRIDITGNTSVKYSNVTLTFIGPATGHFGAQAIHGVVRSFR